MALKAELAAELAAMTRLHELAHQLLEKTEQSALLMEVLSATMALQHADFGSVRLYHPSTGVLEIVVQSGFGPEFIRHFQVRDEGSVGRRALTRGGRVIVEDVMTDAEFVPHRAIAAATGFRAVQSTPLVGRNGEPLGVMSTHFRHPHHPSERDLRYTDLYARLAAKSIERERTQAALRRSEFHLAEAQRISHTGSWAWNVATGDVLWSDECCRIFGFAPAEETPANELFWGAIHAEDRSFLREQLDKAVAERGNFNVRFRVARSDGSVRHIHSVGHPIGNDGGGLIEYVGTVVDISELELAEERVQRAQNDLARVGRAMSMGQLTASIAHEIAQPLTALVIDADACVCWLAAEPPNLAEARDAVRRIARNAHRTNEVITRIRALLTRSEPLKTELVAGDIIADITTLIQGEARARGVTVQVSVPSELPAVSGDRIQLQQVLLNLALNAIEAMRSVTTRPRQLYMGVARHGAQELRFEVRDSGPGLDSEQRGRVFDAFYTTKNEGMGMGLAICRSIVQAHGGLLWVEANPGPGETFQFTVPIAPQGNEIRS